MNETLNAQSLARVEAMLKEIFQQGQQARAWNMSVSTYQESKSVTIVDNCFAFMFTNIGDVIAEVNGMVIFPNATPATGLGDSRTVGAHLLDLYKGTITLKFRAPTAGTAPNVEIVQLYYLEANKHTRR